MEGSVLPPGSRALRFASAPARPGLPPPTALRPRGCRARSCARCRAGPGPPASELCLLGRSSLKQWLSPPGVGLAKSHDLKGAAHVSSFPPAHLAPGPQSLRSGHCESPGPSLPCVRQRHSRVCCPHGSTARSRDNVCTTEPSRFPTPRPQPPRRCGCGSVDVWSVRLGPSAAGPGLLARPHCPRSTCSERRLQSWQSARVLEPEQTRSSALRTPATRSSEYGHPSPRRRAGAGKQPDVAPLGIPSHSLSLLF